MFFKGGVLLLKAKTKLAGTWRRARYRIQRMSFR
jgi:hypothetical protein